jgi:hypothetical protein
MNAIDGSQDNEIHCFKNSPSGRSLLKEGRESIETNKKVVEAHEEIEDIGENVAYDSDDSIEFEF